MPPNKTNNKQAEIRQTLDNWRVVKKKLVKSRPVYLTPALTAKAKQERERRNREFHEQVLNLDQKHLDELNEIDPDHSLSSKTVIASGRTPSYISRRSMAFGGGGLVSGLVLGALCGAAGFIALTEPDPEAHPLLQSQHFNVSAIGDLPNSTAPAASPEIMLSPIDPNQRPLNVLYYLHSFYEPNSIPYSFEPIRTQDIELCNSLSYDTTSSNDKPDHWMIVKGAELLNDSIAGTEENISGSSGEDIRLIVPKYFSITDPPQIVNKDGTLNELAKQKDGQIFTLTRALHNDDDVVIYLKRNEELGYPVFKSKRPKNLNRFEEEIISRVEAAGNDANAIKQALGDYIRRRRLSEAEAYGENAVLYTSTDPKSNLGKVYALLDGELKREIGLNQCFGNVIDICSRILAGILPRAGVNCVLNGDGDDLVDTEGGHAILIFETPDGKQHFFDPTASNLLHPEDLLKANVTKEDASKLKSLLNQITASPKDSEARASLVKKFRESLIQYVKYFRSGRHEFDQILKKVKSN